MAHRCVHDDDIEIAENVEKARQALTDALNKAYGAGLSSEAEVLSVDAVGSRTSRHLIQVRLYRPIPPR
jgi:hypothetical protein